MVCCPSFGSEVRQFYSTMAFFWRSRVYWTCWPRLHSQFPAVLDSILFISERGPHSMLLLAAIGSHEKSNPLMKKMPEKKKLQHSIKFKKKAHILCEKCGAHQCLTGTSNCFITWHERYSSSQSAVYLFILQTALCRVFISHFYYSRVTYLHYIHSESFLFMVSLFL